MSHGNVVLINHCITPSSALPCGAKVHGYVVQLFHAAHHIHAEIFQEYAGSVQVLFVIQSIKHVAIYVPPLAKVCDIVSHHVAVYVATGIHCIV